MASGLLPGNGYTLNGGTTPARPRVPMPSRPRTPRRRAPNPARSPTGRHPAARGGDRTHAPTGTRRPLTPRRPRTVTEAGIALALRAGHRRHHVPGGTDNGGRAPVRRGHEHARRPVDRPGTVLGTAKAAERAVLTLVNKERDKVGCAPVTSDARLTRLAEDFSADMALRDFFDHVDPDGDTPGTAPRRRASRTSAARTSPAARRPPRP
ncbi:CAP domain-containing protein [Streptomyces sp. M19]